MTQIFTGTGLGLHGSSLGQLGNYGPKGTASLGQGGTSLYVNAANGNLVLTQSDGFLANAGIGMDLFQTYNAQSGSWRFNTDSRLTFEGHGQVKRTDEDGHQTRYCYNEQHDAYLAEDGGTGRLTFDGSHWTYREGSGKTECHYNQEGQITSVSDRDGHVLRFNYQNGKLSTVTDSSNKQTITWSFTHGLLTDVIFQSEGKTEHHVHYDYDAQNRLNRIARDLGDGKTYWVAFDYAGDSNLISDIRQSDGTNMHMAYDAEGRIIRLIDGEGRSTSYAYLNGKTIMTNGLGESWTYFYDADARLTGIDGPENYRIRYHYDGNYLDAITQGNQRWNFKYNDAGDCIRIESPTGAVTTRTFDNQHHLLSETRYQTFDNRHQPIKPHTSRYVYDNQGHLRFELSADGVVTEHRYDAHGNRISSRCYLKDRWQEPTLTFDELVSWSQRPCQHDISLVDYHYDWRGCLSEEMHYTKINDQGEGVVCEDTIRTYSRYDASGRLVEKSSYNKGHLNSTYYVYDDLGRLIKTIDNQHHMQTYEYDDAHQRIVKTDANGLQTLSIYDKSGLLLSTQRLDAKHDFGTKTYHYDDAGRLSSETGASGTRYCFYDAQGRLQANVSTRGQVTEYCYDAEGHCIQTRQYQQTVNVGRATHFEDMKPATSSQDRISQVVYNEYNQIAFLIDSEGAVNAFQYDAEGRIIAKTAYAHRLKNHDGSLTIADLVLTPSNQDRSIHYYYDANGRLQAEINGEGAATEYRYDAQGHLIEKMGYKNKVIDNLSGDWNQDAPSASGGRDMHTYSVYNAAGLKTADIDAEGYLTEYVYDSRGLLTDKIAYYTKCTPGHDVSRPNSHSNDHHTTYVYNDLHQLVEESTQNGLVITWEYNDQGLKAQETRTDRKTCESRTQRYRYDALGRVIMSLDAQGVALLEKNPSDVESIWQKHSVRFAYDLAGHLISKTNALNESTRFIYNNAGLLTYTLSPTGGVTETRYNAFDQVETSIRYSAYYTSGASISLDDIKQTMQRLANAQFDETTRYEYNTLGLLISQRKGSGSTQSITYNAFGERSQTAQQNSLTDYQYDRRGLLLYRTEDAGGINKTREFEYDTFGWLEKSWDGQRGVSIYQVNKRGEQIRVETQGLSKKQVYYDAFGRILTVSDKTRVDYTYHDQTHTLTIQREVDKEGQSVVTQFNAFGDTISITDGLHQTTTYQYDVLGQLVHVDAPEHTRIDYEYDATGRLSFKLDAGGHVQCYTYDGEGHVLTKIIDPDGLRITTTFTYDAIGRQLKIDDAGRCKTWMYDDQGQLIQINQDPDGLNLITRYRYNDLGQLESETRANQVTAYTYDALGRCLSKTIDPDGLKLTTSYTYDQNDNVLTQIDANHNTTHYLYDANNNLRYSILANGVLTEHCYDSSGNEIRTIAYANKIAIADHYDNTTVAAMIQLDKADQDRFYNYDAQSRLTRTYDGLGYATDYVYDAHDNVVAKIVYDTPCSLTRLKAGERPQPVKTTQSRITLYAYDGLDHQRFQIDPNGGLTEYGYDAAGQLIQKTRFAHGLACAEMGGTFSIENIQAHLKLDPTHDEANRYAYDKACRLTQQASAAGVVTAYEYDDAGNQTACHQYATRLTASQLSDPNWAAFIQMSSDDRITRTIYDGAGRTIFRISPTGHVVERRYDAVGHVLDEIQHAERWSSMPSDNGHLTHYQYDAAGRLLSQTDAALHTTSYGYDENNNLISKTDANQAKWTYVYNAANQLIETHSPVTSFSTYTNGTWRTDKRTIITKKDYDSFGNLIRDIRDAGGMNQTVEYTYDANNRNRGILYPNRAVNQATQHASNDRQETAQTLMETFAYNAFGERIEHRDKAGFRRHFAYDLMGQQIYAVDAEGAVIHDEYDAFGNVSTKTRFAKRLETRDYSASGIAVALQYSSYDRHEHYDYDADHHLIETRKDVVRSYNPRATTYHQLSPTTRFTYNAFGEAITQSVQLSDVDWAITTHTYDQDGLKIATRDAENYLATYHYDAYGLLESETQYANRGANPAASSKDRCMRFLYNAAGQLIQKTLQHVTVQRLTGNGSRYETITRDLSSYYAYDAMGNLVSTTDPEGNTAFAYYNQQGQLIAKVGMQTRAGRAATTYAYDALGQLVDIHQWANGAHFADETQFTLNSASSTDSIRQDRYDEHGHVTQKIDGNGHITNYSYDANGNVARVWHALDKGLISDKRYTYDRENHLTQTATYHAQGLMATDDAQYNAFGEVIKKGLDGHMVTQVDYDNAGRVWRSNTQGYFQIYVYDLDDHVTQILISSNASIPGVGEKGADLADIFYEKAERFNQDVSRFKLQRRDNTYDALGRLVCQSQDSHMNNGGANDQIDLLRPTQLQTLDRWGNVLSHTNASLHTTRYEYNALDVLTEQILPEVTAVNEHGVAHKLAPTNHYAIDSLGRTIAITDANGHTISHVFDAEGHIIQDMDAQGHHRDKTYNLLGQMSTQINERGGLTTYTYDCENRLLSVVSRQTAQSYQYDGAGHVIRQEDAAGNVQSMTYDELGHLKQKTDRNITTRYEHDAWGNKTAEYDANGKTSVWSYDEYGRLREHTDFGGHRTEYTYNTNGLLLSETSNTGKDLAYHYYSDGHLSCYADKPRTETIKYTYDVEGRIASKITGRPYEWIPETDHYEYDAAGRLIHVKRLQPEDSSLDRTMLSIDYEYDGVGNIRDTCVTANYTGHAATSHTDYFKYDENDRMLINKGLLINGEIEISKSQGTAFDYDETGNIKDAQTWESGVFNHFTYQYDQDNLLERVRKNGKDFQSRRYVDGLLREETLYNDRGTATQYNSLYYKNGRLDGQTTKAQNKAIISETKYDYDNVGNIKTLTTQGTGYTQTHQYDYELWDTYQQKTDSLTLNAEGHATGYGKSTHIYDVNGLLQDVENSQSPNNTTHYFSSTIDGIRGRKNNLDGETSYLTVNGKTIGDLRLDMQKKQHLNVYGGASLPETQQDNLGAYTINPGDTLESIAQQVYGDSSLWYLIADANGITDRTAKAGDTGSQLQAGIRLNIPQVTKGQHHTHQTQKILNSTDWTGDTTAIASPLLSLTPAPPPNKNNNSFWKTIAKIAVVVTAAIAMVMSAGALAAIAGMSQITSLGGLITAGLDALSGTAGLGLTKTIAVGFAAGFTSSIAGQTAANLFNLQKGIDMQGALITALGTAATAGVGQVLSASTSYDTLKKGMNIASPKAFNITHAAEMLERDALTQSLNLALTRHQHFDWLELGVSTATAGVMGSAKAQEWSRIAQQKLGKATPFVTTEVQALATEAISGNFDVTQILKDNAGNALSATLIQPLANHDIEEGGYCPIPTEEGAYSPIPEGTWERFHREDELRRHLDRMAVRYLDGEGGAFNPDGAFGVVGAAVYGDGEGFLVGQGALVGGVLEKNLPDFGGNYQNVVELSAREVWEIRAFQGTPILNKKIGHVDAAERLVGFERGSWRRLTEEKISFNLDSLQQYVLEAHNKYPNVSVDLINSVVAHESKGAWNAVSPTGALGVMQLTSDNYLMGNGPSFNPFNPQKSILYGTKILSDNLVKFGISKGGLNKALAAYNQGFGHVSRAVDRYGSDWIKHINLEGRNYVQCIKEMRTNGSHIPGYFGEKK